MAKKTSKKKTAAVDVIAKEYDDLRSKANYDEVVFQFLNNYEIARATISKTIKEIKVLRSLSLKTLKQSGRSTLIKEKEQELLALQIKKFEHVISFMVSVRRTYKLDTRGGYRRETFIKEFLTYQENVSRWRQMGFK